MQKNILRFSDEKVEKVFKIQYNLTNLEGSPNGMAVVLKTTGSNPLEVRLLYPPP